MCPSATLPTAGWALCPEQPQGQGPFSSVCTHLSCSWTHRPPSLLYLHSPHLDQVSPPLLGDMPGFLHVPSPHPRPWSLPSSLFGLTPPACSPSSAHPVPGLCSGRCGLLVLLKLTRPLLTRLPLLLRVFSATLLLLFTQPLGCTFPASLSTVTQLSARSQGCVRSLPDVAGAGELCFHHVAGSPTLSHVLTLVCR